MSVSWLSYVGVLFQDKTVAVEVSYDTQGQAIALKAAKKHPQGEHYSKNIEEKAVQVLNDTLTFVCVFRKSEDPKKALKYLYKIKNSFAFKYCNADISKATKKELKGKLEGFKDEMIKQGKVLDTGINMELTHEANRKVKEVTDILQSAVKKQVKANELTDKLLDDSHNIYGLARSIQGSAEKMEPSCCRKFWTCSKPCIIIFVVIGVSIAAYFVISFARCGNASPIC
eukprot:TRINITY_DN8435_c0_g1_i11.p1 TRINITY_DN8435_c0_g1~~TRINITY_DN8435_c0_g1_i11.p1  ORF type:complete len:228 (+),score=77.12 TRINITY_DN8435_c0_g1_i11:133-816(+)